MNNSSEAPPRLPIAIEVSNTQAYLPINLAWVFQIVTSTLEAEEIDQASISVAIMDDAAIRVINARHLTHDWATDVISFRFDDEDDSEMAGELAISAQTAQQMAGSLGIDPQHELALYLVHGLLHLCGYDDQSPDDVASMRRREAEILAQIGLVDLHERAADLAPAAAESDGESMTWPL